MKLNFQFRTLYDSKGLEFNDVRPVQSHYNLNTDEKKVLLYNFFEDSTATLSQWRLVLNEVERRNRSCEAPVFDETRHASICSEASCVTVLSLTPLF
jgi:hypothetical protein